MKPNLKQRTQEWLLRMRLYHRLKASPIYGAYWRFADKRVIQRRAEELAFYRNNLAGLGTGDLIFDVGANQGLKTELFLSLGARVVAVDPDSSNQEILRQKFHSI